MSLVQFKIKKATFDEVHPIWEKLLWVNRQSPIKTHSSIPYLGGCDMSIYDNPVTFWKVVDDGDVVVGVNSGFKTADGYYRSRGIYVNKNYRTGVISKLLFDAIDKQALAEECKYVWSIPRKTAIRSYERVGFVKTSDWFDEGMEFGPNCYVLKILK